MIWHAHLLSTKIFIFYATVSVFHRGIDYQKDKKSYHNKRTQVVRRTSCVLCSKNTVIKQNDVTVRNRLRQTSAPKPNDFNLVPIQFADEDFNYQSTSWVTNNFYNRIRILGVCLTFLCVSTLFSFSFYKIQRTRENFMAKKKMGVCNLKHLFV